MKLIHSISLCEKDLSAIRSASSLLKQNFPVNEVKLFGSKARGDDTPESDIDLLVLTSRKISWHERNKMTDFLYDVQMKYDVVISLLVIPSKDWTSGLPSALPIHDVIEKESVAA